MSSIPFNRELSFDYGALESVAPGIRRVVAKNPGPFTLYGTGTYVIGDGRVAVIDPGPLDQTHVDALLRGLQGETITHILVTHTHLDHSPACALLRGHTDAPTYGYGPHGLGKLERGVVIEEGGDMDFTPDIKIKHGDVISGDGWTVECVYTPGHTSNHMCFHYREENALFSGDHVMGWSTTIVSPPDGDMGDYMRSLDVLLARDDRIYWPTHGPAIEDPRPYVQAYRDHRRQREQQILAQLAQGVSQIEVMLPDMYQGLDPRLLPAAARSVLATLVYLVESGRVVCDETLSTQANYRLA